jgi:DNA-binding NtrC family response regulator
VNVLAVSPLAKDHQALGRIFAHSDWKISAVSSLGEAKEQLLDPSISVVICDRDLPDGSWHELLSELSGRDTPPRLVVTSAQADDQLWAEVLNRGGYDVLAQPFDPSEVFRVVSLAWRHWRDEIKGYRLATAYA